MLYGTTLTLLTGRVAVEAAHTSHAARVALRCLLALTVFATMSIWVRANRSALDLQNWCDCAGEQMTIRVIESRPSRSTARTLEPAVVTPAPVEEEYETAIR